MVLFYSQIRTFSSKGLNVAAASDKAKQADIISGRCQLVYFSPEELLLVDQWRTMLLNSVYQSNLVAFVVDEAHCITNWLVYVHVLCP